MNWITISTALALMVACIALLQGWSILRGPNKTTTLHLLGFLTILLAVLGIIFAFLYTSTGIVISPELRALMVQEGLPYLFFCILVLGLSLFLSLGWYALRLTAGGQPRLLWSFAGAVAIGIGILLAARQAIPVDFDAPRIYVYRFWRVLAFLALFLILVFRISFIRRRNDWRDELKAVRAVSLTHLIQHRFLIGILAVLAVGLAIVIYDFDLPGPALGAIIFLLAWLSLTEVLTHGALISLYKDIRSGGGSQLNRVLQGVRKPFRRNPNDPTPSPPNQADSSASKGSAWRTIFNLALLFVVLVFLSEALNSGKTITQPFQAIGLGEHAAQADAINERLINDLAQLNQQLQPDVILLTQGKRNNVNFIRAKDASSTIDAIVANSGNIDLGTIKIPLNALVSPIQSLARPIFKVRVLNGSIFPEGNHYILLANASDGGTWRTQATGEEVDQAIPGLVEEMAFQIMISEPSLHEYGITRSWEAFQSFQRGMQDIQQYESIEDYEALTKSIQDFREAIQADHNFALAYYRLGLALQENSQPWQAEEALRTGLSLNPISVPLKNALAYHLYFYDSYVPNEPAAVPPSESSDTAMDKHQDQARRLWHQIVRLPLRQVSLTDLASAYSGLCRDATDQMQADDTDQVPAHQNHILLGYFYCYRSQNLLERLPMELQSVDKIHQAEAENLNNLALIVKENAPTKDLTDSDWNCLGFKLSDDQSKLAEVASYSYSQAAMRYYERAVAMEPQNAVIQCNAAINAKLMGQSGWMDNLAASAPAHYQLAVQYLDQARRTSLGRKTPSPYYKAAFEEFQAAIDNDSMYPDALNEYAYAYWVFRLQWPQVNPESLGIDHITDHAESYARKALRLAQVQQDSASEAIYASTVAEVLMTQGSPQKAREAEQILVKLFQEGKVPNIYFFDDIRWELAQASLCSAQLDPGGKLVNKEAMERQARAYLRMIREEEEALEIRLFSRTDIGDILSTSYRLPFCKP